MKGIVGAPKKTSSRPVYLDEHGRNGSRRNGRYPERDAIRSRRSKERLLAQIHAPSVEEKPPSWLSFLRLPQWPGSLRLTVFLARLGTTANLGLIFAATFLIGLLAHFDNSGSAPVAAAAILWNPTARALFALLGWHHVALYGADSSGTSDSSTAVQAALDVAKATGGTLYFGIGRFLIATTLNGDQNSKSFTVRGSGGGMEHTSTSSVLIYTGTATGPTGGLIHFNSTFGFEVCHLGFNYDSDSGFAGDLINVDGVPHAADCQDFHFHHCTSDTDPTFGTRTARSILRLRNAIIGSIDHCHWTNADNSLRVGEPSSYVVSVEIEKCIFNYANDAHILMGAGDGESVKIRDCAFEAGINTTAIKGQSGNLFWTVAIEGNWFGDASGTTKWIDGINAARAGVIRGNELHDVGVGGVHMNIGGRWAVEDNWIVGGTAYACPTPNLLWLKALHNMYDSVDPLFDPTSFPSGPAGFDYYSWGNSGADDTLPVSFSLGGNISALPAAGPGAGGFVLGASAGVGGYPAADTRAKILKNGGDLALQPPDTGTGSLIAGTARKVQWNATGVAFNGETPVGKRTLGAAATDAATTQTLANNIRQAMIDVGLGQT